MTKETYKMAADLMHSISSLDNIISQVELDYRLLIMVNGAELELNSEETERIIKVLRDIRNSYIYRFENI